MNSSTVINTLYEFFGQKKNKLTWSGTLEDLKAFVLTIIDEETAQSTQWRSPSGGKWCFDSAHLKVTWHSKSEVISFDGAKAEALSKRIHDVIVKSSKPERDDNIELNQSIECFMAEADFEANSSNPDGLTPRLCTSILQVSNVSCCNNTDNKCDEDSFGQNGFGKHKVVHQDLLESESISFDPEDVSVNACCSCCTKHRENIEKLHAEIAVLKKAVFSEGEESEKSAIYMQMSRLRRDNSALITSVELLSKQLLNLSEKSDNPKNSTNDTAIIPENPNAKDPSSKVTKNKKKKQRKTGKDNDASKQTSNLPISHASLPNYTQDQSISDASFPNHIQAAPDASLPRDTSSSRDISSSKTSKSSPSDDDTIQSAKRVEGQSPNKKEKDVVVIAGDSLVKNMVGAYMSKDDPTHYYVVKAFSGATVTDMEDFIKPIIRKSPNKVIVHVGTNDLKKDYTPKVIADSIINLTTQIKEDLPNSTVGVSALLVRSDSPNLATKVKQVNFILDNYCHMNKIPFLRNANINNSHLNNRGLHLNKLGSLRLQNNFIEFINNLDNN